MRIAIGMNRWMPWALGAFMAVGAAGCAGSSPSADDDSDVDEATAAVQSDTDAGRPGRGMRGHGRGMAGPGALFHLALGELELTDAQRTKVEEAMKSLAPPERGDRERPDPTKLADAIRANKVDAKALASELGPPDKPDMAAMHGKVVAALQVLHDTLTSEQRTTLVAAAKEKLAKGPGPDGDHGPKGDRRGPPDGDDGPPDGRGRGGPPGMKGKGSPVDFLLHGIEVTDAQRAKIDEALTKADLAGPPKDAPSREEMQKRMTEMKAKGEAMLDAFAKDAFDAKASVPQPPDGAMAHGPPKGRFLETLAVVVPLLEQAQRDELADRIMEGPMKHGKHGER